MTMRLERTLDATRLGLAAMTIMAATLGAAGTAAAAPAPGGEDAALDLVDSHAVEAPVAPGALHAQLEVAGQASHSVAGVDASSIRLSPTLRYDRAAGAWRFVADDRFDFLRSDQPGRDASLNSLRELYAGLRPSENTVVEAGRVNVTNGVAVGYNPTDYFRTDSVRYAVSADPTTLRINRLGTVLVRGQTLWDGGSLAAIAAPRLVAQPGTSTWSLDLGATNRDDRFLLSGTQRLAEGVTPQWLVFRDGDAPAQLGLGLNGLFGDSTVAFLEWSGGRSRTNVDTALSVAGPYAFHQKLALGLTWTSANQVSLTLEYDHDGAAPDATAWHALQADDAARWGTYRRWATSRQDLTTRNQPFVRVSTTDVGLKGLETAALARWDPIDHSVFAWGQLLYHCNDRFDAALQLQLSRGGRRSDFGATDSHRLAQFSITGFF
jgi:hypothetical protein